MTIGDVEWFREQARDAREDDREINEQWAGDESDFGVEMLKLANTRRGEALAYDRAADALEFLDAEFEQIEHDCGFAIGAGRMAQARRAVRS